MAKSGAAQVQIQFSTAGPISLTSVSVSYAQYSDDGYFVIDGEESAVRNSSSPFIADVFWKSSLTLSGCASGSKETSSDGYRVILNLWNPVVESTGNLSTALVNTTYTSPNPGI